MDMWSTEGYLQGGPEATAGIAFADAGLPILDGNCFMHRQANFFSQQWPDGTTVGPEGDVNAFYLPTISDDYGKVVLTAGTLMAPFADRPEVMEVLKYVASTDYAETRGAFGGLLFPNLNMDTSVYPTDIEQVFGEILACCRGVSFRWFRPHAWRHRRRRVLDRSRGHRDRIRHR